MRTRIFLLLFICSVAAFVALPAPAPANFSFAILGDRTGEAVPGVYESVWRAMDTEHPAFVVSVGDTIQGLKDQRAEAEWQYARRILQPYSRIPLYLVPGNHDIWSPLSEQLFRKYARHEPHYSFDYRQAHFTILDNSRSEQLSNEEMQFLEADLQAHSGQPVKFVLSHRPSWLISAAIGITQFQLHQVAKKYGVQYIVAGHVHEMLHVDLDGVTYISAPSSGGHLRLSAKYEDGWFFGHLLVSVRGNEVTFQVKEAGEPHGEGRITKLSDWGLTGLTRAKAAAASQSPADPRRSGPGF